MRVYLDDIHYVHPESKSAFEEVLYQSGVDLVQPKDTKDGQLPRVDLIILHYQEDEQKLAYISALAIAQKVPVIFLIPKGNRVPEMLSYIQKNKSLEKYVRTSFYSRDSLKKSFQEALAHFELKVLQETPTIKFTLRITPSMERYLKWKNKQTGKSKADFLREAIQEQIIDKDSKYKK
jgi:hypothetical protein